MKLAVDEKKCAGHALCTIIAPDHFAMNDAGKAEVIADVQSGDVELAEESVAECPAAAILLISGDSDV